jgi:integrase
MRVASEGPAKITKATVDAAWRRRKPNHRLIVRDKECRGLALVVNPTAMRWEYAYRPRGTDPVTGRRWPNRTVTLGNPQTHSPDDARFEANQVKGQAASGADPAAEKKARAEADRRKRGATLERLVADYTRALPKRLKLRGAGTLSASYAVAELAQVRLALTDMKAESTPAPDLGEVDVRRLIATSEGVTTARKRFGALSRFLDWCQDAGHIATNPCALIGRSRRPKAPQPRSHYLTVAELARLWRGADALREPVWRDLVRFLIAVPCRRNEASRLNWAHLDLANAEWRQPSHMTKNRDPHRLHLHALALEVLHARQSATKGQGLVFPAPLSGRAVDTFTDLRDRIVRATKSDTEGTAVDGWTWHDFRRSFATALGEACVSEAVADGILNHRQSATRGGVLGVYQRATRWPEQVRAMQLWGQLLQAAIEPSGASAKVVPMMALTA